MYSDTKWLSTGDSANRNGDSRHRNDWLSTSDLVALFRRNTHSTNSDFINSATTKELIKVLLKNDNIEKILLSCIAGLPPLLAVIDDVDEFVDKNKSDQDIFDSEGKIRRSWKQNVGKLIGSIAYFIGYTRNKEINFERYSSYFTNASNFKKETI